MTVFPATTTVPLAGGVAMAILVDTPLICAVRLMATGVLNAVVTVAGAVTTGTAGDTVMLTKAGGVEIVPPGPCAR